MTIRRTPNGCDAVDIDQCYALPAGHRSRLHARGPPGRGEKGTTMPTIFRHRRKITAVALVVTAATLAGIGTGRSEEKGPPLEFWQAHFDRNAQAFHDWDKEKEIPAVCARCHGADKIPEYLKDGKNTPAQHVKNGFTCTNCHADMLTYERHKVSKVTFANGITVDSGNNDSNLCMTCHQGRESTASLNKAIAGLALDTPNPKLDFVH